MMVSHLMLVMGSSGTACWGRGNFDCCRSLRILPYLTNYILFRCGEATLFISLFCCSWDITDFFHKPVESWSRAPKRKYPGVALRSLSQLSLSILQSWATKRSPEPRLWKLTAGVIDRVTGTDKSYFRNHMDTPQSRPILQGTV